MNQEELEALAQLIREAQAMLAARPEIMMITQAIMTGSAEQIQEMIRESKTYRANLIRSTHRVSASEARERMVTAKRVATMIEGLEKLLAFRQGSTSVI